MSPTNLRDEVSAVTDDTFEREVLLRDHPVLVEFWARWCPPCRMMAPVLAEIAGERAGSLVVCTVNTDENPLVTRDYQVMSLPAVLLFRAGHPLRTIVGARAKAKLLSEVDEALRG
ncbi:thioredoxin [Amycolatopsis cihanbeyliensis]|uniref:Thioredoxin n=1 Tax=Amycolatopsis cihanbeyliensis TaxID=1128664 RepID=A0A542DEL6_AMYCI|nr:thioredoxin [Amycolatopsis cihanbeyliensis]TQJ01512.1 thioredoxin [Amycolatopsis cihanbeyliensis]